MYAIWRPSSTDVEYQNRRWVSRREQFLETMDVTIAESRWVELIVPCSYNGKKGRKPKARETRLPTYLLQAWFSLPCLLSSTRPRGTGRGSRPSRG